MKEVVNDLMNNIKQVKSIAIFGDFNFFDF